MISFLASYVDDALAAGLRENLAAGVGVPYELLLHDNRGHGWGLARSYNTLAARAAHPILCFVHADVRFLSPPGWGRTLVEFFEGHPEAGVVGFAGSQVKSRSSSGWAGLPAYTRENLLQHLGAGRTALRQVNPDGEAFSRVVVLDGLCLISTAEVWRANRFDEAAYGGFHLYDLDYSTSVARTHANYVCHTVLAEHFSPGVFRADWREASAAYHAKWASRLPIASTPLSPEALADCEAYAAYRWLRTLLEDPSAPAAALAEAWAGYRPLARPAYDLRLVKHRLRAAWRRRWA